MPAAAPGTASIEARAVGLRPDGHTAVDRQLYQMGEDLVRQRAWRFIAWLQGSFGGCQTSVLDRLPRKATILSISASLRLRLTSACP